MAHEYCFFLHDQSTRLLVEYEGAEAYVVSIKFKDEAEADGRERKTETFLPNAPTNPT